jgi:hypothetical protein
MLSEEKSAGGAIGRHIALPRKYVSECLARLGLGDDSPASSLQGREQEVVRTLAALVDDARERPEPCVCETARGDEIYVIPPRGLKVKISGKTLSELCDGLFLQEVAVEPEKVQPEEAKRKELEATIARLRTESESLVARASRAREEARKARSSELEDGVRALRDLGVKTQRPPGSPASVASILLDHAKELE